MIIKRHIDEYKLILKDEIKPIIKRVDGVSGTMGGGGREQEMQVNLDINKLVFIIFYNSSSYRYFTS